MVRSYLISFLATRAAVLATGFAKKYPGVWLVWEPGAWHAPETGAGARKTIAGFKPATTPSGTDALCFQLQLDEGKTAIKIGRDEKLDVVINDATVSREHLTLSRSGESWSATPAKDRLVKKDGSPISDSMASPLVSGTRLELGSVTLTFYDGSSFEKRVWGKSEKK